MIFIADIGSGHASDLNDNKLCSMWIRCLIEITRLSRDRFVQDIFLSKSSLIKKKYLFNKYRTHVFVFTYWRLPGRDQHHVVTIVKIHVRNVYHVGNQIWGVVTQYMRVMDRNRDDNPPLPCGCHDNKHTRRRIKVWDEWRLRREIYKSLYVSSKLLRLTP